MKNIIKQPKILTNVHRSAQKSGLDTMTGNKILAEIASYRKEKKNR